jgi:hypothetical protein
MSASIISTIDWELIGKAFTNLTTAKKCWVTKHASASTDLFLVSALAMAFFTPCSAILTQSYGKSIRQFWLIFA